MDSVVKELRKPASDLKKFSGDPLEYRRFLRQYNARVVSNTTTSDERLNFLEQFTDGEANKIGAGYSCLEADVGYPAALAELERRYGDKELVANAYIKRALDWPIIKSDNPSGLDSYAIFLVECQNAVNAIDALRILEYSENLKRLVTKLPYRLHDKWRSIAQETREKGAVVKFDQLVRMVQREAKKVMDPLYGRQAMQVPNLQMGGKDQKPVVKRKNFATEVTSGSANRTSSMSQGEHPKSGSSSTSTSSNGS
jgi:hypothetical protein